MRAKGLSFFVLVAVVGLLGSVIGPISPAAALSGSSFNPGNIISDANFFNASAMSQGAIQSFLESQEGGCTASSGMPCLKDYRENTFYRAPVEPGHCSAYAAGSSELASQIIWKVAQACQISPMVLLVTLQKEQSLVTKTAPTASNYRIAMGYGCPDTAPCDAQYYGFYNQVYNAAWQFRQYTNYPNGRRYHIGSSYVQYNPNSGCGGTNVDIKNQATANLYLYTPYQPNSAALTYLYGTGDSCSAYGNRNFWRFYSDWFGSPTGGKSPIGSVDVLAASPGKLRVVGWALDPDTTQSIPVHVYVGAAGTAITANADRPDVNAVYGKGNLHGFDVYIPVTSVGVQNVCIYGIDMNGDANALIACRNIVVGGGSPVGQYTINANVDGLTVTGWAIDPDVTAPIDVHVYIDNSVAGVRADRPSPGTDGRFPGLGYGDSHGFTYSATPSPGRHNVCVYGINVQAGGNALLSCQSVVIGDQGKLPFGSLDVVSTSPNAINFSGWAIDPDTSKSIQVHLYVDNIGVAVVANQTRNDVAAAYPGYGPLHGFTGSVTAGPGVHNACAYAINSGPGGNQLIRCQKITLGQKAIGAVDKFTITDGIATAGGWALLQGRKDTVTVQLRVDGNSIAEVAATGQRPDVGRVYPDSGAAHGYDIRAFIPSVGRELCVVAITSEGTASNLSCKPIGTILPSGSLDTVTTTPGSIRVTGWAFSSTSPQTPIYFQVTVDGDAPRTYQANSPRQDVANAYPGVGPNHGVDVTVPVAPGAHNVCVTALDQNGGSRNFGCRSVAVQ